MAEPLPELESIDPSGVHPQLLQMLRLARASQAFLATLPRPLELWEALLLTHTQRMFLRCWLELRMRRIEADAAGEAESTVLGKLDDLRRHQGPWMAGLRAVLAGVPEQKLDRETTEVLLALLAVSPGAREQALAWIGDPVGSSDALEKELGRLVPLAQAYLKAIDTNTARREKDPAPAPPPEASAAPPPAPPPPPSESRSPITRILPRGVKMETLEDVGRVDDCRRMLREFDPEVQVWECFCLVMSDEASRRTIDDLVRRRKAAPAQTFAQEAQPLFGRLQEIRKEHAEFVRALVGFLAELPVGSYSTETRELALGFIVAGPLGREHATLWLSDPAHYRQEASTKFEGLVGRAMNYQAALRAFAE
jgi:hypothetical protein